MCVSRLQMSFGCREKSSARTYVGLLGVATSQSGIVFGDELPATRISSGRPLGSDRAHEWAGKTTVVFFSCGDSRSRRTRQIGC
jgi:hypothetical protein